MAQIAGGNTIRVTLTTGQAVTRNFVAADDSELIALDLTDGTLPRQVRRTLRTLASDQPTDLFGVAHGQTLTEGQLRLGPDGVFLDSRKIAALELVLEQIARHNVAEIGRVHKATRRGIAWGALIGAGIGLAATLSACGTNWSQETSSCTNLTPIWVFIGPLWGTLIGGVVGAGTNVSTVVYKAP